MSTKFEFEIARDNNGFLNCEDCQRRFITKIGFENHSCNQHKKEAETEPNEHQQPQTKKDESETTVHKLWLPNSYNCQDYMSVLYLD